MDWAALKRIVTGNGADGRSAVVIEGGAANVLAAGEAGLAEIWSAPLSKARLLDGKDRLADEAVKLEPAPGALKVRWFTVPPEDPAATPEDQEAAAAFAFAMAQAEHARVDTARHPMMHKTQTLDVIVVVKGRVRLLLDEGPPRDLAPGDVVIQRATNHAWVNEGAETALLVAVLAAGG